MKATPVVESNGQSAQTAAMASWMALVVPIPVRIVLQSAVKDAGANAWMLNFVSVAVTIGCVVIGLAAGIYALTKVREVGRKGVLVPALIGTLMNAGFFAMVAYAFLVGFRGR